MFTCLLLEIFQFFVQTLTSQEYRVNKRCSRFEIIGWGKFLYIITTKCLKCIIMGNVLEFDVCKAYITSCVSIDGGQTTLRRRNETNIRSLYFNEILVYYHCGLTI